MNKNVPVPRTAQKGARDLVVIAVSSGLLMIAEQAGDFGLPADYTPIISSLALMLYRTLRDQVGSTPD